MSHVRLRRIKLSRCHLGKGRLITLVELGHKNKFQRLWMSLGTLARFREFGYYLSLTFLRLELSSATQVHWLSSGTLVEMKSFG